ncbi:MAG: HAD family phosphatase [Chloroflexi bacterium]|nr:HAD family phosphatase [Chloroflexota bacterium]
MPIKVIIFDMGDVLIQHDDTLEHTAVQAMCTDPEYAGTRIPQLIPFDRVHRGELTFADLFRLLAEEVGLTADYPAFASAMTSGFGPPIPGIAHVVDSLIERFSLALLSNTNAVHWSYAKSHYAALLDKVRPHFVSFELGMMKPQPEIFRHVVAALGVEPKDCLLIDDNEANGRGARVAGLDEIRFRSSEQLIAELEARDVL